MKNVFIGGAWPYANNSMHIGHLAALLPGDVLARFFRMSGKNVIYVSGSDCHGTPITQRAQTLGVSPSVIANHYHEEFAKNFSDLGFTYDVYSNTMTEQHKQNVQNILKSINQKGLLFEKTELNDYCPTCKKFVVDREIKGICPVCGSVANGDQCDKCLTALTPQMLKEKTCKICGTKTVSKEDTNLYFKLSAFEDVITKYLEANKKAWRPTAINETQKYLNQGLVDRAITRALNWGIELPFEGYSDKRVYVWIDAVLGYLTTCEMACKQKGLDYPDFLTSKDTVSYYVHGKDNIVFHTIILPALLDAIDKKLNKPQMIVSCEYVNLNNDKMSKSKGNLITVNTLLENFDSDSIRYFFILNNPERKDCSFSLEDFVLIHNKHIVGGFGNFANRNLAFLEKKFEGKLPKVDIDDEIKKYVQNTYDEIGKLYEAGELKTACTKLYDYIQFANKYYDTNTPWTYAKKDLDKFNKITSNCLYLMANMANLYSPIIPKGCQKLKDMLGVKCDKWQPVCYDENIVLHDVGVLYQRLKLEDIDMTKGATDTLKV